MNFIHGTKSDKLNIIDHSTYTQIQGQSNANISNCRIRNVKYRKNHLSESFDLLSIATKVKGTRKPQNAHHRKLYSLSQSRTPFKKTGKIREEQQKKISRTKKLVLKCRKERQHNETIETISKKINKMHIDKGNEATSTNKHFKKTIHSRNFREYCDNCTTPELGEACKELLQDLDRFQKRAYEKNPIKANAHRRIVIGFRQIKINLEVNKIKLVIIATNCEKCDVDGGLDDTIESLKTECRNRGIPYVFPLHRRHLAYALKKRGNISCIGILDYHGAGEKFSQLMSYLEIARERYAALTRHE